MYIKIYILFGFVMLMPILLAKVECPLLSAVIEDIAIVGSKHICC